MANVINFDPNDDAVVILRGVPIPLASDVGGAFISDCSRNKEKLLNDRQICERYGLTLKGWEKIAENKKVVQAVCTEHERRVRSGVAAQEAAAKLFATAPKILGDIMNNPYSSPRHKVEAIRELRATATNNHENTPDSADRFVISINLGGDEKLVFDKERAPLTPDKARENVDGNEG
jgi:hypothetical protein